MKKLILTTLLSLVCSAFTVSAETVVTDCYDLRMSIQTPRIYDNMESQGYRKYQTQTLVGTLKIVYRGEERPEIVITNLVNKTHKINGKCITYTCEVDAEGCVGPMTRVNLIGSNKKDTFYTPSVVFYVDAEPSYNLGEDDEDNSLLITVSGVGSTANSKQYQARIIKSLHGFVTGTLGCGCKAYGHVSPTRVAGPWGATDIVDDVAAVLGKWRATFKCRAYTKTKD